jgi:hypothetical protein
MKKQFFLLAFLLAIFLPAGAQNIKADEEPIESLTLKKGNIPASVLSTADEIFKENKQVQWGTFPYQLKKYGWVIDTVNKPRPNLYEIYLKTKDGIDIYAIFDGRGNLIRYRTIEKNGALPVPVLNAIAKTQYNDWKVEPGTVLITDKQNNVEEHYSVKLTKGNRKKTLYFTKEGNQVFNK